MKVWKKTNLIFCLTLMGCLFFSRIPTASGFIPLVHPHQFPDVNISVQEALKRWNLLIHKVHAPSWKIGYRFSTKCSPEYREKSAEFEEMIATVLREWLQPLHGMQLPRPITDDFQFSLQADVHFDKLDDFSLPADFHFDKLDDLDVRRSVDLLITFHCMPGAPTAFIGTRLPPEINMRLGTNADLPLLSYVLSHELGHAFGLADTYLSKGDKSSGGLASTVGTQPSSSMAGVPPGVREDDKRGIVYLYKATHEGIVPEDCLFSDYVYEEETIGCRPKHPLIFEAKYGYWVAVFRLLDNDPTIDVNTQDPTGMTALHHAAALGGENVVERLLEHKDIDPSLRDKQGQTALDIAREANLTEIIALLQATTARQIVEDVNGDGSVNILDLVVVARNFGKQGNNKADVDGNRVVDIRDLVKVASLLQ